jgi:hypothetical protein
MLYRIPNLSPEYLRVIEGLNEMRLRLTDAVAAVEGEPPLIDERTEA